MFQLFSEYKGLPKNIYIVFAANVINRFGDFVSPLLALYLTQKLNMDASTTSFIVTLALLSRMPGSYLGGKMADHMGRRVTYLITQTIAGLTLLPCAFIDNHFIIICLLIVSTFFNGAVRPALDALVIDLVPQSKRKLGLSLMYLGINIGVAVGPALAGILFKINLQIFFLVDVVTSLIAVLLVFVFIKETYTVYGQDDEPSKAQTESKESIFDVLIQNKQLSIFLIITSFFSMVYIQTKFALPLLFADEFGLNGSSLLGVLFSINAVTVILCTSFMTHKTKNNPAAVNVIFGGLFYAIGFGLYGLVSGYGLYVMATIIWTFGEILMFINIKAFVADHTPVNFRGRINAISQMLNAATKSAGVLISGWLIPVIGHSKIWLLVFGACLILSGIIYLDNRVEIERFVKGKGQKETPPLDGVKGKF